jgi:hypothetical protein
VLGMQTVRMQHTAGPVPLVTGPIAGMGSLLAPYTPLSDGGVDVGEATA